MNPLSTVENSKCWKIWHSLNYNIGGMTFLFGSILLFPYFTQIFPIGVSGAISAWLYTIGSFTFAVADFTEWTHYESKVTCDPNSFCCRYSGFSINFLISFTGSFLYLVGSAMFLPFINNLDAGLKYFIVASAIIVFSQTWKLMRVVKEGQQKGNIKEAINEDLPGVLVDLFAGLGALMYFIGSFIFFNPDILAQIISATIYSVGGFFFYLSGTYMLRRYFIMQSSKHEGAFQLSTSEMRSEEKEGN